MTVKKWIDPTTGENFVEEIIDLPLSKLSYLKYLPHLCAIIGISLLLEGIICIQLGMMHHSLEIVIKKHLYVITQGPDPSEKIKGQYRK